MDHTVATRLIKDTFTQSFDENHFRNFAINLLNNIDESKAFPPIQGQYIKDAFKTHIRQYKRIGTYTDPDGLKIDVMIVYLHRESALDHARTMQRNFMVDYLKNRDQKDAALVAYIGEDKTDWRFSLVRMEYKTIQTESGKVKVKEDFTPARRYSFLVGENEPNHTAQVQLLPILEDTQKNPSLEKLETAFNIESVTKEFFEKYKELFLQLKEELDSISAKNGTIQAEFTRCEIDTAAFAKKLLGQIVFLYFLQKKGWMGVQPENNWGSGSKNFLFDLFEKKYGNYQNFFHDMLEPLFYQALAVERKDNLYIPLNCKIPFLNGGLFEPLGGYDWQKKEILITNDIFKTVFEIFNQYNFTVREDEPLEREVAVDPEMLGKVFENLLEVKDRKGKGAFYTPREIVHYMCQESLVNYLDTTLNKRDEKLVQDTPPQGNLFGALVPSQKSLVTEVYVPFVPREDIEVFIRHGDVAADFDAAKESGNRSYDWLLKESIRTHAKEIDHALADIKVCDPAIGSGAFPVGIMSEIIKARGVLSKYLPKDVVRTAYAFKRHAIENSIYGVDLDSSAVDIARLRLWLSLVVEEEDFQSIKPLPNLDYKIVCGNSLQSVKMGYYKGDIKALTHQFTNETDPDKKKLLRTEIDKLIRLLTKNSDQFDFHIYFLEVFDEKDGFDVIIGNPPYGVKIDNKERPDLRKRFPLVSDYEIFQYFISLSVNLLHKNGLLNFIIPNTYALNVTARQSRLALSTLGSLIKIVDLSDFNVFERANVRSIILTFQKLRNLECEFSKASIGMRLVDNVKRVQQTSLIESETWKKFIGVSTSRTKILDDILSKFPSLEPEYCIVKQGYIPYRKTTLIKKFGEIEANKILKNRSWHSSKKESNDYLRELQGADITRYSVHWSGTWVKYGKWVSTYLPVDEVFSGERILIREITRKPPYALYCAKSDEIFVHNPSILALLVKNSTISVNFVLGLLNSRLISEIFLYCSPKAEKGLFPKVIITDAKRLPVPPIKSLSGEQKTLYSKIEKIAGQIHNSKINDIPIDLKPLETEIDRLVYELYGLKEKEIEIIENGVK
jgi:hypothetical protein